jgi:hypothetical protein
VLFPEVHRGTASEAVLSEEIARDRFVVPMALQSWGDRAFGHPFMHRQILMLAVAAGLCHPA